MTEKQFLILAIIVAVLTALFMFFTVSEKGPSKSFEPSESEKKKSDINKTVKEKVERQIKENMEQEESVNNIP